MATNTNVPWGLQPYQNRGSEDYRARANVYYVPANTTNAMFIGDPVIKTAASADTTYGYDGVNIITAGSSNKITGMIVGFLGTNPNGAFFGASGAPGQYYKASNAAAAQWVLVDDSPNSLFVVQCTGNPAATVVGKNANLVSGQGNKTRGWSGWQVSATTGTSANAQVQIVGFVQDVSNVIGSQFPKLIVRINQSTEGVGATGI